MKTRQGISQQSSNSPRVPDMLPTLRGLADNTILADQIICVAKKYLDSNCDKNDPNLQQCIDSEASRLIQKYSGNRWRKQNGSLKTSGDNLFDNYPNIVNFCAIFVWEVWFEAVTCLGGVDGNEDTYLFKSSRVYDTALSMRLGTQAGGKTLIDKNPSPGSAFTRRRDTQAGGVGHAGIVIEVNSGGFTTIEANGDLGIPYEQRKYLTTDIAKYDMFFLHIEDTPVIQAQYPSEDGNCCPPPFQKDTGPCDDAQMPSGTGWERTHTAIYNSILATQGNERTAILQGYATQGLEFSSEYCFVRTKTTTTNSGCESTVCPPGYEKPAAGLNVVRRDGTIYDEDLKAYRKALPIEYCCVKIPTPPPTNTKCPDVTGSSQNCKVAVRVSAKTFDATSVPHYSVLYQNRLMAADITGSKWTFQMLSKTGGTEIGSALALPPAKKGLTTLNGDALENAGIQFSGFGTFSDGNGNLIVIVPEWQTSRLNSLIGAKDNDGKQVKSILGPQGFFQINVHAYTGNGAVHAQAADANYICGSDVVIDGMNPAVLTTNSNSLHWYSEWDSKKFANVQKERFVDENLFAGGTKLPIESLIFDYIVTSKDNQRPGLLNLIESQQKKYDKPILVVLKSSPPPFDWMNFVETVITIAASFTKMVGIPPQIFTQALSAIKTIESIAKGDGNVLGSVVKLAGLVSALLPANLRGQINEMIGDAAKDILGTEATEFLQEQERLVGKYLVDAKNLLQDITNAPIKAFQSLGFDKSASEMLQNKFLGKLITDIQDFRPPWYEFASDYAKNLKGDFNAGFNEGVKLLHSIDSIQTAQSFARHADSTQLETDIKSKGSAFKVTEFQNLMVSGLAGGVMASTPNITKILSAIMNSTGNIIQGAYNSEQTNIGEIASILKVANGFMGDPKDFDRMTLQSLLMKVDDLTSKDKITKFVLPPSLTSQQQECWGKELNQCFGIEIVTDKGIIKKDTVTKDIPVPVKYPPCIKIVNGSFKYCPPSTCKTGLSDEYNPSANYRLDCPEITAENMRGMVDIALNAKQTLDNKGNTIFNYNGVLYQERPKIQGNAIGTYNIPNTKGDYGYRLFYGLCEMVEVPTTPIVTTPTVKNQTTTTQTPQAENQPCAVMYDARVSPGTPDRWYANIAGQWVEIIDCCPTGGTQNGKDCCDETQSKLNQMKLDIAKVVELVGRNQAGEKCPECDLSAIKKMIADLKFPEQKTYDDTDLRKEMREGFAEMRAMIGQMKQYDVSKDLNEIKDLIKAIKIADCQAVSEEVKQLRKLVETQMSNATIPIAKTGQTDTAYIDQKYEELKNLILSKQTISQKDYSTELAQIQRDIDYFKKEFTKTTSTITTEVQNTTSPEMKQELEKLLKEQTELFTKKINDLQVKLTKPCEECTELGKIQKQIDDVKVLIQNIKPGTNTVTTKEADTSAIDRLTKSLESLLVKYDQMYSAFSGEIERLKLEKRDTTDLERQLSEQNDIYNEYIIDYKRKIKELDATAKIPEPQTQTPILNKNGECTNCPKVVESHTRTIYEYPPQQSLIQSNCEDDDC